MIVRPMLFERYPRLADRIPWIELGSFPTPLSRMRALEEHLGCEALFVKRDDLSAQAYGGNKIRKLEFILAEAMRMNANPVVTLGALGSNHVLATAVHGRRLGLDTVGVVIPQPVQEYLRSNVLACLATGCRIEYCRHPFLVPARVARVFAESLAKDRRRPYFLWAGGSNLMGVLGYVEAAFEIAAQVESGELPEPDFIFVPVGSAGTLAGLALGLRFAGLKSRPMGVRVYGGAVANPYVTAFMASRACRYLRRLDPTVPNTTLLPSHLTIFDEFLGRGYAWFTSPGNRAVELSKSLEGLTLDGTYSGKAMAGFMHFMSRKENRGKPALFVATYNSRPLPRLSDEASEISALPPEIRAYFEKEIARVCD